MGTDTEEYMKTEREKRLEVVLSDVLDTALRYKLEESDFCVEEAREALSDTTDRNPSESISAGEVDRDALEAFDRLVREHIGQTVPGIGTLEIPADAQPLIDKVDAALTHLSEPAVPEAVKEELDNLIEVAKLIGKAGERLPAHSCRKIQRALAQHGERVSYIREKYYELLYAVATKHPGESRHETALRYIQQAENRPDQCQATSCGEKNDGN